MNRDSLEETISAALDGEAVHLSELREALQSAEGRELLASCALIRATAGAGDIEPSAGFAGALRKSAAAPPRRRVWLAGPRIPASIAASFVMLAVAGTLLASRGIQSRASVDQRPRQAPIAVRDSAAAPGQVTPAAQLPPADGQPSLRSVEQRGRARGAVLPEPPKPSKVLLFDDWRHGA